MNEQVELTDLQYKQLSDIICQRISAGEKVRRTLPGGRIHIDRQLPFICIYRKPEKAKDEGTYRLVMGEASYLVCTGNKREFKNLSNLVYEVVKTLSREFGGFLVLEIWSSKSKITKKNDKRQLLQPVFHLSSSELEYGPLKSTTDKLADTLSSIKVSKLQATVIKDFDRTEVAPGGMSPILNNVQLKNCGATLLGLEVRPIHIDAATKKHYPLVLRQLHKGVSTSIQKTVFEFVRKNTTHKPPSYQALGRRATVKAVWAVDEQLADLTKDFDFLLQVTPINMNELWREFSRIKFDKAPAFYYRPLLIDPGLLKKKLWNIPIKRLEDPTISQIFREKRRELDIQFSMLSSLDNRDFLYNSLQLYGALDKKLIYFARKILLTNVIEQNEKSRKKFVDADQFYRRVNEEIKFYRRQYKGFSAKAMVRNDINAGLLVSKNCLFIDQNIKIPTTRVEALLHHEVGTHLLTYYNGLSQPFRLLSIGLSGYEELQEGLAVISELLVGELSRYRLVVLAARVIACKWLVDGASFIETYRVLVNKYHLDEQTAFTITLRVYRGGGLTKDSVYLRGLLRLLEYLKKGNKLDGLFVGKISYEHIPIIKELQHRKILGPTPLKPRYLDDPQVRARLEKLKNGTAIKDIIIGRLI